MAMRTMKGIYVKNAMPDMMRHLTRHERASIDDHIRTHTYINKEAIPSNIPCSTWGSSNVTAFSVSVPPTRRVSGIGTNEATHHRGNKMKPMKKHHAWKGDASSSSLPK